jgi:hypothetical protein
MALTDYSTTAASNTAISGIDITGATGLVKNGDNAIRQMMADIRAGVITGYTTTATAAGTTTLTVASNSYQYFTGATTQTVVMPVTSTLELGRTWVIVNNSTGSLTINSSGGNLIKTLLGGQTIAIRCILITGTSAASWSAIQETGNTFGQIRFPATQNASSDANTLDDYEEGQGTLGAVTSGSGTITTVGTKTYFYTKVGRQVTVNIYISITTNGTGATSINVADMPFAFLTSVNHTANGSGRSSLGLQLQLAMGSASTTCQITNYDNTYPAADGVALRGTITYFTD